MMAEAAAWGLLDDEALVSDCEEAEMKKRMGDEWKEQAIASWNLPEKLALNWKKDCAQDELVVGGFWDPWWAYLERLARGAGFQK